MNDYIQTWHAEHLAILRALAEIPKLGLGSAAGQAKILALETALLAHLKSESENLYPILNQAAQGIRS